MIAYSRYFFILYPFLVIEAGNSALVDRDHPFLRLNTLIGCIFSYLHTCAHLGCFQYFVAPNSAAVTKLLHIYFCIIGSVSSRLISRLDMARLKGKCIHRYQLPKYSPKKKKKDSLFVFKVLSSDGTFVRFSISYPLVPLRLKSFQTQLLYFISVVPALSMSISKSQNSVVSCGFGIKVFSSYLSLGLGSALLFLYFLYLFLSL